MSLPRISAWILLRSLDPGERECVLGDCEEEHAAIVAARGKARANRWFRTQVVRSFAFNLLRRWRRPRALPRLHGDGFTMTTIYDLRYAARQLWRTPGFTIPALLTLALGIGLTTAVFTVVYRVILRPLPYPAPERLVRLWDRNEAVGLPRFSVSPGNYFDWRRRTRTLANVGAFREDAFTLTTRDGAERLEGARVTASFLDVLGVNPVAGRSLQPADDRPGGGRVVLVTHGLASRLGGASVVGDTITVDGLQHAIVGVLPADFMFPQQDRVELLVPYALDEAAPEREAHFLRVIGRMTPEASLATVRAELGSIATALQREQPKWNRGWDVAMDTLHRSIVGDVQRSLLILFGAAGLLLIITSANVAGLLLARSASRAGEFAVRAALGAGTRRLARQLIVESLLLSTLGGLAGLWLGSLALDVLLVAGNDALPRTAEISIDRTVVLIMTGVSLVTGLTFGVVPLLARGVRPDLRARLEGAGRGAARASQPIRRLLVAGQIALALSLTIGATLLVRHLVTLQQIDPGFTRNGVLTMELRPPAGPYGAPPARVRLYREIIERLERLPGAQIAGATHRLPLDGNSGVRLHFVGRAADPARPAPNLNYRAVAGRYFEAIGIRVVRGRSFSEAEMWDGAGAVVINVAAAERYFADGDPLLAQIVGPRGEPLPVVGIVENVRENRLADAAEPAIYFPYATYPAPPMTLLVRSAGTLPTLAREAQRTLSDLDATLVVGKVRTLDEFMREVVAAPRFNTLLLSTFAALALVLAAIGIYGITAYAVAQRTPEIGIRMALGAAEHDIFRTIVAPGLQLAAAGSVAGLAGAALVARLLGGMVLGVNAQQPVIYGVTAVVFFAIASIAILVPARRAMRIDPVVALRQE